MKFVQFAVCSLALTAAAAAQMATPPPAASAPAASPSPAPQITSLGGDAVKGPEHPLTLDQMKVLYVAMGYDKTIDQNFKQMLTMQKTRAPFIPTDFWDDLDSSFSKIDYSSALLDVYKKYLSTDDAAKLIDFSKTEAGQHFLQTLPETTREAQMAIQKQQQTTGQAVQARHKDELDAAIKKYREEHAPKPAPSLGAPTPAPGAAPTSSTPPASGSSATPAKPATPPASTTPPATTPQN
jgi:hypothetical protein